MTTNDSNDPTTEELEAANRMLMEMEQTHLQEFGEIPDWILTAKLAVLKELQRDEDSPVRSISSPKKWRDLKDALLGGRL